MCPPSGRWPRLALLLLGFVRRNDHLKHVGLEALFIIALLTLPVYVSGVAALLRDAGRARTCPSTP